MPLINAERSWAHAMEAKGQLEGDHKAQVRQNVLRKLNKAAAHASEFSRFASKRGTARWDLMHCQHPRNLQPKFEDALRIRCGNDSF